ncbi:MAG: isoprenylcysteine carboxylmethyltransferase family protein [Clostridia bacterium]|nr:isoprenylcysteine carboxylmethyltransferase family protein [Clostridia bacterium]
MDKKLLIDALVKVTLGIVIMGLLLFLPAGTLNWWQGWLLLAVLFVPMIAAGFVMMKKSPDLLRKRLNVKEKQKDQQLVVKLSGLMFLAGFILAGLGKRFGWWTLPSWVSWAGAALFLLAYAMYAEVLRENAFLSRTIEVQENQTVVDTGLYGIVRHPMYAATLVLFLSMPLVLGSLWAFLVFLAYPFIIAGRIRGEETLLRAELAGYEEYCRKVKWRVIPFVW